MSWQDFHFIRPWWLLMLLPVVVALLRLWWRSGSESAWRAVVSPELLPHLLLDEDSRLSRWPLLVTFAGFLLTILALAGPTWERLPQPVFSNQSSLVVALDLSRSMDARDIRPSRLQSARFKVEDILRLRKEGQTALIVFAGAPFTVSPLTDDVKTITAQLPALTTDIMPVQGSNTAAAIRHAVELLQQAQQPTGKILLVTDGVNLAASVDEAKKAVDLGYQVSVLGVGTEEGAPIPARNGVIKDAQGNIVIAALKENALAEVAQAGHGRYVRMTLDDSDIRSLALVDADHNVTAAGDTTDREIARWQDFGPWLLLGVLPLAALAFRKGILLLALVMVMPLPGRVEADWWSDLWSRPDQQGQRWLEQEQPEQAAQVFQNPDWKASALYRAGDYEAAEKLWSDAQDANARYNLGNALAREGELEQAIAAYDEALEKNPDLEDARANRELLKKLLEQQEQQQQKNQQQPGEQKDKQQSGEQKQDQQQSGSQQQQQEKQSPQAGNNQQQNQQSQQGQAGEPQDQKQDQQAEQDASQSRQGQNKEQQAEQNSPSESADAEKEQEQQGQPDTAMNEQQRQEKEKMRAAAEAARAEEEKQAEEKRKAQQAREEPSSDEQQQLQSANLQDQQAEPMDEQSLSREQWLRRIPDDPGGLLRRKFKYYYQRKQYDVPQQQPW